jgi:hypothetical protein
MASTNARRARSGFGSCIPGSEIELASRKMSIGRSKIRSEKLSTMSDCADNVRAQVWRLLQSQDFCVRQTQDVLDLLRQEVERLGKLLGESEITAGINELSILLQRVRGYITETRICGMKDLNKGVCEGALFVATT